MSSFTLAAKAAIGLTVAGIAYQYAQQKKSETGREPWDDKRDVHYYDFIVLGGRESKQGWSLVLSSFRQGHAITLSHYATNSHH